LKPESRPRISVVAARRIALRAQLLRGARIPRGKEGVARIVEHLGYVQIDTIAIIERAHQHTLWTRHPDYRPELLHELQARDRRLFEYWGHAASYLPINDYRFCLPRMRRFYDTQDRWVRHCMKQAGHLLEPVLRRIREEGALRSQDFARPQDGKRGPWWDWKPAKVALELLFWRGELMVSERRGFERVYDLPERVLPEHVDTTCPGENELGRFLVRRALQSLGLAREAEIRGHIRAAGRETIARALRELLEAGEVRELTVAGTDGVYYAARETLERRSPGPLRERKVRLLSPFDNLVIDRERIRRLFGFDYALECYVPAPKRKFGYFALPILWGDELVGRLDPAADRKGRRLNVRRLALDPGADPGTEFPPALAEALTGLARFNNSREIVLERVQPTRFAPELKRLLKNR